MSNLSHPAWNEERENELLQLCKDGLSASQIARVMGGGITRNAVIGKLGRLHATLARQHGHHKKTQKPRTARAYVPVVVAPKPEPEPVVDVPIGKGVKLAKLGAHQCKWPLDDYDLRHGFPSCGRKTGGGSWCEEHRRRVYQVHKREVA